MGTQNLTLAWGLHGFLVVNEILLRDEVLFQTRCEDGEVVLGVSSGSPQAQEVVKNHNLVGGFNQSEKCARQIGSFPQIRVENKNTVPQSQ